MSAADEIAKLRGEVDALRLENERLGGPADNFPSAQTAEFIADKAINFVEGTVRDWLPPGEFSSARVHLVGIVKTAIDQTVASALVKVRHDSRRLKGLRNLMGFIQDGSSGTVKLYQDEATGDFFVSTGRRSYWGESFDTAIDAAIKADELTAEITQEEQT